ncbi:MAG: DUF1295 domain-containing protein, partial [Cytophagales bacterium]|nr:DUF1295 domain-containing protein [Cytophagales bacterium]
MAEQILQMFLVGLLLVFVIMYAAWLYQLKTKDASIVDIAWAFCFPVLAGLYFLDATKGFLPRKIMVLAMVSIWAFRLITYLFRRSLGKKIEDGRYQNLREEWGKDRVSTKMFEFFQFQGLFALALSLPFAVISLNNEPELHPLEYVGVVLWLVSMLGESIADNQLKHFKKDPNNKGKICEVGLWKYSRHPNYFFEWLVWVSFSVVSLSSPNGWITVVCPVLLLIYMLKVTG